MEVKRVLLSTTRTLWLHNFVKVGREPRRGEHSCMPAIPDQLVACSQIWRGLGRGAR
jgi:hypothetical protein